MWLYGKFQLLRYGLERRVERGCEDSSGFFLLACSDTYFGWSVDRFQALQPRIISDMYRVKFYSIIITHTGSNMIFILQLNK